jgi:signal transduction histidine kinase
MDVLGMLTSNLQKVGEHGQNTTRTLKAMEEMLKDRSGGIVKIDLCSVLHQNREMVDTYYQKEIAEHHINVAFNYPNTPLYVHANPELLSKTFMSMLGNSIYAVMRKAKHTAFEPEVTLKVSTSDENIIMCFHDNGIGIEDTIIDKIFDPFFTTKTTGEASGIGLYLSHDVIQNYGGDISVRSVKNEFTEFTVILPVIKE